LATKEGKVLENPFSFEELYHPYADSWRISEGDSMLVPCGGQVKPGIPEKPFVTRDLNPDLAVKTREICDKAGPRDGALLEACMLDVAMLGNERAAAIYAKTPAPAKVGTIRQ
jgi:hypothetical protein